MKDWLNGKKNPMGHKKRYLSVMEIADTRGDKHLLTISGDDHFAHALGNWLNEDSPFEVTKIQAFVARIYSPLTD